MNQAEETRLKVDHFMRTLKAYINAEIIWASGDVEEESMGSYHEEVEMREALVDLLGLPEGT